MAAQFFSGTIDDLVKKYRALTIEKHELEIRELESRIQMLETLDGSRQHIKECQAALRRIKKDYENFKTASYEVFKQIVMSRDLLLNVVGAFDKRKIEESEGHLLPFSRVEEIASEREHRIGHYRKMDVSSLLVAAVSNEMTEIEILKIKINQNEQALGLGTFGE